MSYRREFSGVLEGLKGNSDRGFRGNSEAFKCGFKHFMAFYGFQEGSRWFKGPSRRSFRRVTEAFRNVSMHFKVFKDVSD